MERKQSFKEAVKWSNETQKIKDEGENGMDVKLLYIIGIFLLAIIILCIVFFIYREPIVGYLSSQNKENKKLESSGEGLEFKRMPKTGLKPDIKCTASESSSLGSSTTSSGSSETSEN